MPTREIPRDEWREELDGFSRQHEGWIVRVDVTEPGGRTRTEVADVPLQGVSADSADLRRVAISVGDRPDDHLTHEVKDPVGVAIDRTDAGAVRALSVRAADGSAATVTFRSPMRPDEVDGIPGGGR